MKKIFTSLAFLFVISMAFAVDITINTENPPIAEGDVLVVKSDATLTINMATAPNFSIKVESGGNCIINNMPTVTGNIEVAFNGKLAIVPTADLTIGQNVVVKGLGIPSTIDLLAVMSLSGLAGGTPAILTLGSETCINSVSFAGDLTLESGGFMDIKYPAETTSSSVVYNDLYLNAEVIPTEFVPLLQAALGAKPEYAEYTDLLVPGVIPFGLRYNPGANQPTIGDIFPTLTVREIKIEGLDAAKVNPFLTAMLSPEQLALLASIPGDGTCTTNTIDVSSYSPPVPSLTADMFLEIVVPQSGEYTAKMPQMISGAKSWYLTDENNSGVKIDLESDNVDDRTYSVNLTAGSTANRIKIISEDKPITGINLESVTDEIIRSVYYSLTGVEILNPQSGNIYIVKNIYRSGKLETAKIRLQ